LASGIGEAPCALAADGASRAAATAIAATVLVRRDMCIMCLFLK